MRGSAGSAYRLGVQEGKVMPLLFLPPFRTEVRRGRLRRNKSGAKGGAKMPTSTAGSAGGGGQKNEAGIEKLLVLLSSVVFGGTPLSL